MPELPEVETVARGLRQAILGRRIISVTLGKTDFIDDPVALEQHLPGRRIEAVERYGKFMLLRLSALNRERGVTTNGDAAPASLLVHLGMTGQIAPSPAGQPLEKHTHVCMLLDDGRELRYADESLWKAKIHPARLGANLSRKQAHTLRRVLQNILRKAIVLRGSSISDFLDAEGEPGEYQRHHRAYGREGKGCYRCKTPVRRAIVAGRSSYFCPRCQPSPRGFAALPLAGKNGRKTKRKDAEDAEKSRRRNGKSR